jgi:hypothetical protein
MSNAEGVERIVLACMLCDGAEEGHDTLCPEVCDAERDV